jgi:indole-3-glycerol phosphate synthase
MTMLGEIVARTRETVAVRKRTFPLDRVMGSSPTPGARRAFGHALVRPGRLNVIAEFKRRSPSKGSIRDDARVVNVAQGYEVAGAAALSVVTEEHYFLGSLDDLQQARSATLLPTLRKDFIVDPYQVHEAAMAGADAILLIAAVLSVSELRSLRLLAEQSGLESLVEVHDPTELGMALESGAEIIGVNNRDLKTMRVDVGTSLRLADAIPPECTAVSESGIATREDLSRLRDAGYDAFLVGEHLMSSPDPGGELASLIAP